MRFANARPDNFLTNDYWDNQLCKIAEKIKIKEDDLRLRQKEEDRNERR